jgi:anti-sigma factor RsiW
MLSAFLDGELTQADGQRVRLHLEDCAECREALAEMQRIQSLTRTMTFPVPRDEILDGLERRLSVQAPQRAGWGVFLAAAAAWVVLLLVQALRHLRWPTWEELFAGGILSGLLLVFLSVLRQRWLEQQHDPYRKVRR